MKKSYYKIYMSVFVGALISITPYTSTLAKPGDVINTSNKKAYLNVYENKDTLNALIDDILDGNDGNEEGKTDNFMTEAEDGKFFNSNKMYEREKEAIKETLEKNGININDEEAVKAFIKNAENRNKINESIESARNNYILEHAEKIDIKGFEEGAILKATVDSKTNLIKLQGSVSSKKSKPIGIKVLDAKNKMVYINQFKTDDKGKFNHEFDFMNNTTGNYTIKLMMDSLQNPVEKTFSFKLQGIKEIIALNDVEVEYGFEYKLPKTITVILDDGSKQEVAIFWDQIINTKKPGTYNVVGSIKGTELKANLKVIVKEQAPEAIAREALDNLQLAIEGKKLTDDKLLKDAKLALEKAEKSVALVLNEELKKQFESELEGKKEVVVVSEKCKNDIENYEKLIMYGDYNDYEGVIRKIYKYYDELNEVGKFNISDETKSDIKDRLGRRIGTYNTYSKANSEINEKLRAMEAIVQKIQQNNNDKSLYDEYENAYKDLGDLNSAGINEATKISLEGKRDNDKRKAASTIVVTRNFKEILKDNNVKLFFAGEEISNFTSGYSISVEDKDNYGKLVSVNLSTGEVSLDNDKGINDDKEYDEIVTIKNDFWNRKIAFYVTIKDGKDKDTITLGGKQVTFIYELESPGDMVVSLGEECKLPEKVRAHYTSGVVGDVPVLWEGKADTEKPGVYVIQGKVEGTDLSVTMRVFVREEEKIEKLEELKVITVGINEQFILPNKIKATTSYGNEISCNVKWDKTIDTSHEGTYDLAGTVEGTELKASLKVVVRALTENEIAENKVKKLENSVNDDKNLMDDNLNAIAITNFESAEAAVKALKVPDKNLEDRISKVKECLDATKEIKPIFEKYSAIGLKDFTKDETDREFREEYNVINDAFDKVRDKLNDSTRTTVSNKISDVAQMLNATYAVRRNINNLNGENSVKVDDYGTIKAYEEACKAVWGSDKEKLNEATINGLEALINKDKLKAASKLENALKVEKGIDNGHIKLFFTGTEVSIDSNYVLEVIDNGGYENAAVKVDAGGKLILDGDKGNNDNKKYVQTIAIKNLFWGNRAIFNVTITDGDGKDSISVN